MLKCASGGHMVDDEEIVIGKGNTEGQICRACAHRLKIPYLDKKEKKFFTFGKKDALEGWVDGSHLRGQHMKDPYRSPAQKKAIRAFSKVLI